MMFSVMSGYAFVLLFWMYYLLYYPLISLDFTVLLSVVFGGFMFVLVVIGMLKIIGIRKFYDDYEEDE